MLTTQTRLQQESIPKAPEQLSVDQQIDLMRYAGSWVNRGVFTPTDHNEQFQLLGSCASIPQRAVDLLECKDGPLILRIAERISNAVQILQLSVTGFMKDALNEVNGIYAIASLLSEDPISQLIDGLKEDAKELRTYHDRTEQALLSNRCIERLVEECGLSTTFERVLSMADEQDRQIFDLLVAEIKEVASTIDPKAPSSQRLRRQASMILEITHTLQRLVGTAPDYHTQQSRYGDLDLIYSDQDVANAFSFGKEE